MVPANAKALLDFIASYESGPTDGYNVVYGHHERSLPKPITAMSINELLGNQAHWGHEWGSSAAGRYQFMPATLRGLLPQVGLVGSELFSPEVQDRLGYQLLLRRGFARFISRETSQVDFGKQLAEEWASFPVLAATQGAHRPISRGQSYYAGDGLNKSLVTPEKVESVLSSIIAEPAFSGASTPPLPPIAQTVPGEAHNWLGELITAILSLFQRKT